MAAEFRLFGDIELLVSGQLVDLGHARQRFVLGVLLTEANHVVQADQLVARVWGEGRLPANPVATLQTYVSLLRRALGSAGVAIARRGSGYQLDLDPDVIDLHRFRGLLARAGVADDAETVGLLQEALGLWRGEPLAGLDTAWASDIRAVLSLQRHGARLDLSDLLLRRGKHAALLTELAVQSSEYPLDERLASQLMLAYYRCGRQGDALAQYLATRQRLAQELGTDPGPALRRLHQQILAVDPALELGESAASTATVVPRELPATVRHFTGRQAELAALTRFADQGAGQAPGTVVITAIDGTAGVGKTALALHWAHQAADRFPDGQLYVNLRGYDSGQPVPAVDALATLLRALGLPGQEIPAEEDERAARYRSLLTGRRMLILLDNARSAEQVRPLLSAAADCVTLVTSRDALAGLVAREGAARIDLDPLPMNESLGLLRVLVGDRVDAAPEAARVLAAQCGRLPLALRVAAELAVVRPHVPLTDLVSELSDDRQRLDRLDAGGDSGTAVRAVFSWSYRHLAADIARVFRLAALHPGPDLDHHAAAALTGLPADKAGRALGRLARAHLIAAAGPDRYALHDLLRAYARELAGGPDGDDTRLALTALFDYFLHTVAAAMDSAFPAERDRRPRIAAGPAPGPPMTDPAVARAWLDAERASLVAAAAQMAAEGWPGHATRLATSLAGYLYTAGHYPEAITIHTWAHRTAHDSGDKAAESAALTNLGLAHSEQGRYERAADCYRQARELSRDAGDELGEARAVGNLALIQWRRGDQQQAHDSFQRVLVLFREIGDQFGEARALGNLGGIEWRQGRYQGAAEYQRQCLRLCREISDRAGAAQALCRLGLISFRQGRHGPASDYFRQTLDLRREIGDRAGESEALHRLGAVRGRQDRLQEAAGYLLQALSLFRELGDRVGEGRSLGAFGSVEWRRGHRSQAMSYFKRALELCRQAGDRYGEAEILNSFGEALLAADRPGHARTQLAAALALALQLGDKYEQARAHDGLGHACRATEDLRQAGRHWQQALNLYTFLGAPEAALVRQVVGSGLRRHVQPQVAESRSSSSSSTCSARSRSPTGCTSSAAVRSSVSARPTSSTRTRSTSATWHRALTATTAQSLSIQTDLVSRYSSRACWPISRPQPLIL